MTPAYPVAGFPRAGHVAQAAAPGEPAPLVPAKGAGGKTPRLVPLSPPMAPGGALSSAAALDLALSAAADPDRETGLVPAGRSSLPGPACLQPAGPGTTSSVPVTRSRQPSGGTAAGRGRTRAPAGGALASSQADSVPPDRPNPIAAAMSEDRGPDSLDAHVRKLTADLGLLRYHTHDARRSPEGFPDLVCVGPGGVLFRELKRQGKNPTPAQQQWLDALTAAGSDADTWRPADLLSGRIASELAAISALKVATA